MKKWYRIFKTETFYNKIFRHINEKNRILFVIGAGIASGRSEVWILVGRRDFYLFHCVHMGSGAQPASCLVDSMVLFGNGGWLVKRWRRRCHHGMDNLLHAIYPGNKPSARTYSQDRQWTYNATLTEAHSCIHCFVEMQRGLLVLSLCL